MKKKVFITYAFLLVTIIQSYSQDMFHSLTFKVSVAEYLASSFKPEGRLLIFLTTEPNGQPADKTWPGSSMKHYIFARTYTSWNINDTLIIESSEDWEAWGRTGKCTFDSIPEGTYYFQLLWQQNFDGFATHEDGNLRSAKRKLVINASQSIEEKLTWVYESWMEGEPHPHVKFVQVKSDTLSKWWGKTIYEHAAILLPSGYYENPDIEYPVYYFIGGGESNSVVAAQQMKWWKEFADWWMAEDAPQIITVYLDGSKNRNIYHLDSENLGPHGYSLINEFIPYIENQYRGSQSPDTRFIGGCSTGGFGSLALQLFYPETFNGVFSYNPDPLSFSELMYINIYEDENFFYDELGYPTMLRQLGRSDNPVSWKDWVELENVLGPSGTYLDADHVLGIWSAIFGPKGVDGLPVPMVDPLTGTIDTEVAQSWSKYDLSKYVADNWDLIGPALQGKIYISCNVIDSYYLDKGVRVFESTLDDLVNPEPQAIIEWAPGIGHCSEYSPMKVMKQIEERIKKMNTTK